MLKIVDLLFKSHIFCISALLVTIGVPAYADVTANSIDNEGKIFSQALENEVIEVTGVQVNPTDKGLEIILQTPKGDKLKVLPKNDGNNFVADIPNSQLRLPKGDTFTQEKPATGISSITVTNLDSKNIRVTVMGKTALPKVELFDGDDGLVFVVTAGSLATPPQQPQAPKKPDETNPINKKPSESVAENDEPIELVITAQKTEENLQDVPISVTAIGEKQIQDAGITNIQGIANNTPNFTALTSAGGRFFSFYSMRGLSNSNFLSRSDTVSFYIDDIPVDGGFYIDKELIDLERVEVLRGPQSTLYGRNAQAGVVNIISKKPSNKPEIKTSAGFGSYNARDLQLSLSDAIIPDKLFFRLSGGYAARDGFGQNTLTNENLGQQSSISGRGQLLWTPSPDWTISFNATQSYNNDGGYGYASTTAKNRYDSALNESGTVELNDSSQALKVAYDNANFRFTSITTHRNSNQDSTGDGDVSAIDFFRNVNNFSTNIWSQEVRLQSPSDVDKFRWLVGGYYESKDVNYLELYKFTPISQAFYGAFDTRRIAANSSGNIYAAFAQVDYKPIQTLTLTAGLRYESASTTMTRSNNFEVNGVAVAPAGQTFINAETSSSELLPKIGVEYRFNPNIMTYASITRGYKPGGLNYRADVPGSLKFAPEKSWNYEVGLKSSWLDDKLIANLAVFNTQLDNYQAALPDPVTGLFSSITNAGASISGAEFELKAKPVRGLELSAGFGYTDGKYSNYVNPLTGSNYNGNRLPFSPEYTYNLAAQYRTSGGLLGRLELLGFGSYLLNDANSIKQDPFMLVNARIGYEGNNYGIYVFVNNLFDTRYITQGFEYPPPNVIAAYGAPTTVGVQVRASF